MGNYSLKLYAMRTSLLGWIIEFSSLPVWGNARDVETLAKSMARKAFAHTAKDAEIVTLSAEDARDCIENMLEKCRDRVSYQLSSQPSVSRYI